MVLMWLDVGIGWRRRRGPADGCLPRARQRCRVK